MSEIIKLKVPEKPGAEKVSVGNFEADLTKPTVETESRKFADHLIANYGLEEIVSKKKKSDAAETRKKDFGFAADFPGKEIFEARKIPFETVQGLTEAQLLTIEGIGKETAAQILGYKPQPIETIKPANEPPTGDQPADGADNSNNGGEV